MPANKTFLEGRKAETSGLYSGRKAVLLAKVEICILFCLIPDEEGSFRVAHKVNFLTTNNAKKELLSSWPNELLSILAHIPFY